MANYPGESFNPDIVAFLFIAIFVIVLVYLGVTHH